jgi:mono/diheme cytochrome c family protein
MKRYLLTLALVLGTLGVGAASIKKAAQLDGKTIFVNNKCSNCHSIKTQGIKGKRPEGGAKPSDLSNTGAKLKPEWIEKWLNKEETLYGKKHMKKFKGTPEELHILAEWLSSLHDKM